VAFGIKKNARGSISLSAPGSQGRGLLKFKDMKLTIPTWPTQRHIIINASILLLFFATVIFLAITFTAPENRNAGTLLISETALCSDTISDGRLNINGTLVSITVEKGKCVFVTIKW